MVFQPKWSCYSVIGDAEQFSFLPCEGCYPGWYSAPSGGTQRGWFNLYVELSMDTDRPHRPQTFHITPLTCPVHHSAICNFWPLLTQIFIKSMNFSCHILQFDMLKSDTFCSVQDPGTCTYFRRDGIDYWINWKCSHRQSDDPKLFVWRAKYHSHHSPAQSPIYPATHCFSAPVA